jgi:hypothetical protein
VQAAQYAAPSSGFVVVNAELDIEQASASVTDVESEIVQESTGQASWYHDSGTLTSFFGSLAGNVSESAVFPVTAGVNTFDITGLVYASSSPASATAYIDATAVFSPFGSTGGSTLAPKHAGRANAVQPAAAHH